ncbi:PREDICTED: chymotrypsin-1-like [Wasmannia auropunctata]|uniref:chymotrypsin-1-like n=1 Tax=Wasmannia auropunctata TaxID=64793 RepID=UPI0005F05BD0|nr:PREDICTED: chymotrypsin-1-like [Wasmannia auropunctata]XP_011691266.1 PREDICTED: chymotrypsin-1-like [Wasmannia auropunctata]
MLPLILLVVGVLTQQTFAEKLVAAVVGQFAAPGEFPHHVSLRLANRHICSGSIIAPTKILTAARCVDSIIYYLPYGNFTVATDTISRPNKGERHEVENIRVHPGYAGLQVTDLRNDIAVITLKKSIQFNAYQSPIGLTTVKPSRGQRCILSGWSNGPFGPLTPLLKLEQVVITQSQCRRHYDTPLTKGHLCTINRYGIAGCRDDSGGPLICNGQLAGIVSWGAPDCSKRRPDVFTDTYYYRAFILSD